MIVSDRKISGGKFIRNIFIVITILTLCSVFTSLIQGYAESESEENTSFISQKGSKNYKGGKYCIPDLVIPNFSDLSMTVWIPECGLVEGWCTMPGYIEVYDAWIDEMLPLCLTNEVLSMWYIDFYTYGGYELWGGYVEVWQKDEYKGKLLIGYEYLGKQITEMCCFDYWRAYFYLECDPICLDSSFYPEIYDGVLGLCEGGYPGDMIPGKEVDMFFSFDWTGCEPGNDQDFTVKSKRIYR